MLTFNDILRIEGIDPRRVRLVKHQDTRARTPSLYEVWRSDPKRLERYQEVQSRDVFKVGEILASFVVTPNPRRETLFIGLYSVKAVGRARDGSRDPILGSDVGGMHRYTIGRRLDGLSEYVARLTIDWGAGQRAWHQRASRQDKTLTAIRDEIDSPFPGFDKFAWDISRIDDMPPNWKEHLRHVKGVYLRKPR